MEMMRSSRGFKCGACGGKHFEGAKFASICGYKWLCKECIEKFNKGLTVSSEDTSRDNALERKDDKSSHRYYFMMSLSNVNDCDLLYMVANYDCVVNKVNHTAVFGVQHTMRQFAKLGKYGDVEVKVLDTLTNRQTTVYTTDDATSIQSYGMADKFIWV